MQRPIVSLGVALAVTLGIIAACGGEDPPPTPEPSLFISANPRQINDQGQASQITVTATGADGAQGTGTVTLRALAGALGNSAAEETLTLANGKATTSFTCNKSANPQCAGNVRIDGTWNTTTASTTLTVGSSNPNPNPDGGTDGGAPGDGGIRLSVASSKQFVFTAVGDFAEITATLTGNNNAPQPDQQITFDTTVGGLQVTAGDTPVQSLQTPTDATGKAVVRFVETGIAGNASIRARHTASGAQASVAVKITSIQQITHQTTTCGGSACTIMGVKGSGFNEQSQISFKVVDSTGQPVPGVPVTFSIPNPPTGTTVSPTATTNAQGIATAIVSAGPVIGAIVVHAVAIEGRVEVDSPTIGIRGAKVSNQAFSLTCRTVNIGAYISPTPPANYNVVCDVKVVDRFNNPVGTGTSVNFKVEAGNIANSVQTKPYSPTGDNTLEGTGQVTFNTAGSLPVDVTPLEEDRSQFPDAREQEPRGPLGQLTANPRDSLVTVLAYTRGEEFFSDTNSNGVWDEGEQFIDQGEPFVDSNDNGVWDQGEVYIDEAPADSQWNGPNGIWDNNTTIWAETRILYSGRPSLDPTHTYIVPSQFSSSCPGGVPRGGAVRVDMYFGDAYFNRPQAAGTSFTSSHTATKGVPSVLNTGILDDYGFGYERRLFDTSDGRACTPTSNICIWKVYFTTWGRGFVSQAEIKGAPATDTQPCQNDVVTLGTRVLNVTITAQTTGAIQ
ncbi:MAG TPA: Ig-like domain-containing protein [Hyalangium sp.]|nr:Ig-like domain-containing protein [Hyalangium sp.]